MTNLSHVTQQESSKRVLAKQCIQSSSSRHSAQREHTFQINEESDDGSNAKAQEAYPLLA